MSLKDFLFEAEAPKKPEPSAPLPFHGINPSLVATESAAVSIDTGDAEALYQKVHPKEGPLVQFEAMVQTMTAYIPDEITRYRAVLDTLKAQGIYIAVIYREVDDAIRRLDDDEKQFETARAQKTAADVTSRENRAASLQAEISDLQSKLSVLSKTLEAVKVERDALAASIEDRSQKYHASLDSVRKRYKSIGDKLRSIS